MSEKKEAKEIALKNQTNPSPEMLIAQAIDKNVSVETMEKLLAMRNQLKAEQAKEAFFRDLADFQAECPVINKTKEVYDKSGKLRYKYAPLDEIVNQVKSYLKKYGFSYTIQTKQENNSVTAICTAHHIEGHSESSEFTIPIDNDSYMNAPQKVASASTYAKRYAFCHQWGLLTGDEDDDAQSVQYDANNVNPQKKTQDQITLENKVKELINNESFTGQFKYGDKPLDLNEMKRMALKKIANNQYTLQDLQKVYNFAYEILEDKKAKNEFENEQVDEVLGDKELFETETTEGNLSE